MQVLGIPFYGRSWTLSGGDNGYKSQTIGPGNPGQYTNSPGVLNYNEICQMLNQEDWTIIRDHRFKVPYMVNGNQWISYDDVESIKEKVGFLKSKGLAGAMVWSIDCDDFRGNCDSGTYPLLKTIANTLIKGNNGNNYEDNKTSNDESKKLSQKQSPEGNWFKYGEENFSKCGPKAPLRNGKIATCDPNNGGCCSKWGYCGEGPEYCECEECTDYRIKSP